MHQVLYIKLVSSTFQVITVSVDGSRKINLAQDGSLATEASLLDLYARRATFRCDYPGILKYNFIRFSSTGVCTVKLNQELIKKRVCPVVVKTYPNYSSSPKGPSYGLFCRYQLLRYKPWHTSVEHAWGDKEGI